jgi:hypothetical protein
MENWVFLFLGLILAYLLDFTKPWVTSIFQKSTLSIRERRLISLQKEYKTIKNYQKKPEKFLILFMGHILFLLMIGILMLATIGTSIVNVYGKSAEAMKVIRWGAEIWFNLCVVLASYIFFSIALLSIKVLDFDKYKQETIVKLKKLGGNPEELDKIDREIEAEKQGG